MSREASRFIPKRYNNEGNPLCNIPTCNRVCEKFKNGNFKKYCADKEHNTFLMYDYTVWQGVRLRIIKRDNYTCVKCKNNPTIKTYEGKIVHNDSQLCVDHIIPVALGGEMWDDDNLQTLCVECHKDKTKEDIKKIAQKRKTGKIVKGGQKLL